MRRPHLLILASALLLTATALAAPDDLCTCTGKARNKKETKTATFNLANETSVKITYEIAANPPKATPNVMVRLQRKLPSGAFVTIKTLPNLGKDGETEAKQFPAGDYRMEVTATAAVFTVKMKKDK